MLSFPRVLLLPHLPLCLVFLLGACGSAPPTLPSAPQTRSASAPRPEDGRIYRIDAAASRVCILVFRGGAAARLGHNHVLSVPDVTGYVQIPEKGLDGARFELAFRLDAMEVDPPALRQALGAGWASAVTPESIAGTRVNMLGDAGLQAERFPLVRIRSLMLTGESPKLAAQVEIELHGQRRPFWVPLSVETRESQVKAAGSLVLSQSEFGVRPFSVLGGLLAVKDELLVEFELVAKAE